MKDFTVDLNVQSRGITEEGFGTILILDDTKEEGLVPIDPLSDKVEGVAGKIIDSIIAQTPAPRNLVHVGAENLTGEDLKMYLDELDDKYGFFFVTTTNEDESYIATVADWIKRKDKMYFVTIHDMINTEGIKNDNTVIMYTDREDEYPATALASYMSTVSIGSATAKFKTLKGIKAANVSKSKLASLHAQGIITYVEKLGKEQTSEGIATSGEYIDVIMGGYYVKFKVEENLNRLLTTQAKIAYNEQGIALIRNVIEGVADDAVKQDIILADYKVETLRREQVSSSNVADRLYDGATLNAKLAGAIHGGRVKINIVI